MFENIIIKDNAPTDIPRDKNINDTENKIINLLSERQYSLSEVRGLFDSIIDGFEKCMPVTNHRKY